MGIVCRCSQVLFESELAFERAERLALALLVQIALLLQRLRARVFGFLGRLPG